MSRIFRKKIDPDELFARVIKQQDDDTKRASLGVVMMRCKGKYKHIGYKIINEVLKISTDPVKDLQSLLWHVRDNELGEEIVDRIAEYGMEKKEVHETLYTIGDSFRFEKMNKAAKKKARKYYDIYWYKVTGGNPLASRDLLIPNW